MPLETQLSVFVKNTVGSLSELCEALAENQVNIRAIYTVDDVDWGIVSLIVNDVDKAREAISSKGLNCGESQVLAIELTNKPGHLAEMVKRLSEHNINIVHTFATAAGDKGILVLLTTDNKRAAEILDG